MKIQQTQLLSLIPKCLNFVLGKSKYILYFCWIQTLANLFSFLRCRPRESRKGVVRRSDGNCPSSSFFLLRSEITRRGRGKGEEGSSSVFPLFSLAAKEQRVKKKKGTTWDVEIKRITAYKQRAYTYSQAEWIRLHKSCLCFLFFLLVRKRKL